MIIPKRTGRPTGGWVGETETRSSTEATYGQAEIPIDEFACYVDVSNKLLEDAAVDVAAEVAFDLAEEFGRGRRRGVRFRQRRQEAARLHERHGAELHGRRRRHT